MSEPADNAPETEAKHSRGLGSYVVWAFMVVMVYVLSIGPTLALCYRGKLNSKVMVIYKPLPWAFSGNALCKPMVRYLEFWCPEAKYGPPK